MSRAIQDKIRQAALGKNIQDANKGILHIGATRAVGDIWWHYGKMRFRLVYEVGRRTVAAIEFDPYYEKGCK